MKQQRFIIVIHEFWMDSKGFTVIESEAKTKDEAEIEANRLYRQRNRLFNHVDVKVIELEMGERLPQVIRRKLTWEERWSGFADMSSCDFS